MGDSFDVKTYLLAEMSSSSEGTGATGSLPGAKLPSLSRSLLLLFAFNGITLALPTTALMYIVNTRVAVPLSLLPSYAAIAFLPFSLKPCYAYISASFDRNRLLTLLLIASGLCIVVTALVPSGAVLLCILLSFLRGVTSAWPEFLLGLTLIEEAQQIAPFEERASLFQSQAATARNVGSVLAHLLAMGILAIPSLWKGQTEVLEDGVVAVLLVASGGLNLVAAAVAWFGCGDNQNRYGPLQVPPESASAQEPSGFPPSPSYSSLTAIDSSDCESLESASSDASIEQTSSLARGNVYLICLLQISIVFFALQAPLSELMSNSAWRLLAGLAVVGLITTAFASFPLKWENYHCVGLFLILRHAIPTVSFMMGSFLYEIFQSRPFVLQLFPIIDMIVTTLSSWTYGRVWSRYVKGGWFRYVIAATTGLAAVASFCNLLLVRVLPSLDDWRSQIALTVSIKAILSFTSEWKFLPDVVLATVSAGNNATPATTTPVDDESRTPPRPSDTSTSLKYGSLVSCIDFGGQLGALLLGPVVSAFGTTRENDWEHLDDLVLISSFGMLASICLVFLLRR